MPANVPPELHDKWKRCVEQVTADGTSEESAYGICYASVVEGKAEAIAEAGKHGFAMKADEVRMIRGPVKAVGDWELDVLAVPFVGVDGDGQYFDASTDVMEKAFSTPIGIYQHGIKQGGQDYQDKPVIVGYTKPGTLEKRADGWHIRMILDQTIKLAKEIMDAAWKGLVNVSSGSVSHLARLQVGSKLVPYSKDQPGRIAVWPIAEISLWESGNGNFNPASRFAVATPVLKAIYRGANIAIPEILNTDSNSPEAIMAAKKKAIQQAAIGYLTKIKE